MPLFAPVTHSESETLAAWIEDGLRNLRSTAHGLSRVQLRTRPIASNELTLEWLLLHVADVAEQWASRAAAGPAGIPEDSLTYAELVALNAEQSALPEDAPAGTLLEAYDARVARALDSVRSTKLDAEVPAPDAPWFPPGIGPFTGRYCLLHLYTEIQRHSGHADLLREAIDGATMYELIAQDQGEDLSYIGAWFAAHPEVESPF